MKIGIKISDINLSLNGNNDEIILPSKVSSRSKLFESLGFDFVTSHETTSNPFLPLSIASEATNKLDLLSSIALAFVRSPMDLAYIAWDLQRMSKGRLYMGLGSQVRGHVVRRFSSEWHPPIKRMKELITCINQIWECWQNGKELNFNGEYYKINLMTPFFNPGPINFDFPKICLAAVNTKMATLSGDISDGVILHGFSTKKYIQKVLLPEIIKGKKYNNLKNDFMITTGGFLIVSNDDKKIQKEIEQKRSQIAFYASTKSYRKVMEIHNWEGIADKLYRMSVDGKWDQMPKLITDNMLEEFLVVSNVRELKKNIKRKFNYANYMSLPLDLIYEIGLEETKVLLNNIKKN